VLKFTSEKRKEAVSRNNRLVGAYIYGSRGISPRNVLIGAEFYDDDIKSNGSSSSRKTMKEQLQGFLKKVKK